MRRWLIFLFGFLGFMMIATAGFIAIDMSLSEDSREDIRADIGDALDNIEEKPRGRLQRRLAAAVEAMRSFDRGVFHDAEIDLANVMPPAPTGWEQRRFREDDGLEIQKITIKRPVWDPAPIDPKKNGTLYKTVTYVKDDRKIVIRLKADRKDIRILQEGEPTQKVSKILSARKAPKLGRVFATIDGIPVFMHPDYQKNPYYQQGGTEAMALIGTKAGTKQRPVRKVLPMAHRELTFALGDLVDGYVMTNASDVDLIEVLSGLNIAAVQSLLAKPTEKYVAEAGFVYIPEDPPSDKPPALTPAFRAYMELRQNNDDSAPDFEEVYAISLFAARNWEELVEDVPDAVVTDRLVRILGPVPDVLQNAVSAPEPAGGSEYVNEARATGLASPSE